jgi:hypothetical protein
MILPLGGSLRQTTAHQTKHFGHSTSLISRALMPYCNCIAWGAVFTWYSIRYITRLQYPAGAPCFRNRMREMRYTYTVNVPNMRNTIRANSLYCWAFSETSAVSCPQLLVDSSRSWSSWRRAVTCDINNSKYYYTHTLCFFNGKYKYKVTFIYARKLKFALIKICNILCH